MAFTNTKNTKKVRIVLNNVTLSFANIFEPKGFNGGTPRYSGNFLISKEDTETVNKVKEAIKNVIIAEWKEDKPKFKDNQYCIRDGDKESWEGYEGNYYISAGNQEKFPPVIRDLDGSNLREKSEDNTPGDKPQSGDTVNVVLDIWAQNNDFGKRINATLIGVQYVKSGKRFTPKTMEDDLFAETTVKAPVKTTGKLETGGAELKEVKTEEVSEDNPFGEPEPQSKLAFGKKAIEDKKEAIIDEIDEIFKK